MTTISQARSYQERLQDFGGGLGQFLGAVWNVRANVDVQNYENGCNYIYRMYIGNPQVGSLDFAELRAFISQLRQVGAGYKITCQGMNPHHLSDYSDALVSVHRDKLWKCFFHVCYSAGGGAGRARAYVHASGWRAGLNILDFIVRQFGMMPDLYEAKIAGPGHTRLDTIVAYFYYRDTRDALVRMLIDEAGRHPGWFAEGLPTLVRREGRGIGSADEQPEIPLFDADHKEGSFGRFYAVLVWLALRNTPDLGTSTEPRHFLDNVLYSLRLLKINPKTPSMLPAKEDLEAWYAANFP